MSLLALDPAMHMCPVLACLRVTPDHAFGTVHMDRDATLLKLHFNPADRPRLAQSEQRFVKLGDLHADGPAIAVGPPLQPLLPLQPSLNFPRGMCHRTGW